MESFSITTLSVTLVVLLLFSAFFSSSEIGMMALNRYRLRYLARRKHISAMLVKRLLERQDRLLGVILLGNTFTNLASSAIATMIAIRLWGDGSMGVAISTILLTIAVLIFAEVAPKTVAASYPLRVAFFAAWPLSLLLKLLYPIIWLINLLASYLIKLFFIKIKKSAYEPLSGEELRIAVDESQGRIPREHKEMLLSILDLEKITVEDVMIPRNEIMGLDLDDSWDDIRQQLTNSSHTSMVVYNSDINNVVGFLLLRDIVSLLAKGKLDKDALLHVINKAYFIPEGISLNQQLLEFRERKVRTAIVVDEYGDVRGLVTLEDILEEIVGEFTMDTTTISRDVYPQEDGSFVVDGSAMLRDLNKAMAWRLPIDGPKTLSGLIIEHLETIPASSVCLYLANYPIEVIATQDNTIKTARIYPCRVKIAD